MKDTTIKRIIKAACSNETVKIGSYTYKANLHTGEILRCKTSDIGRMWIDRDGNRTTAWEVVANA